VLQLGALIVVSLWWRWCGGGGLFAARRRSSSGGMLYIAIYWNAKGVVHYNCKFRYILIAVIYSK